VASIELGARACVVYKLVIGAAGSEELAPSLLFFYMEHRSNIDNIAMQQRQRGVDAATD
jgi:hypothetical protein